MRKYVHKNKNRQRTELQVELLDLVGDLDD